MTYYSQAGQDEWVHSIVGDRGFFVDIGAYDGVQTSNTYALQKLGWSGICIEAEINAFRKCQQARGIACINAAITDYTGQIGFGIDRVGGENIVNCYKLDDIMNGFVNPSIDYLSIDIEGHELTVLKAFSFDKCPVRLMTVEHNLYCDGPEKKDALFALLTANGFTRVKEDVPCLDPNPLYFMKPYEDWYENPFYKS